MFDAPGDESPVLRLDDACRRFGRGTVRAALSAGRWQRPNPRVVVTHSGPLRPHDELHLAVCSGPAGTALAGPTALTRAGLKGFDPWPEIHVVIGHATRTFRHPRVIVHRTMTLPPDSAIGSPPRTSNERSLVDAGSWSSSDARCRTIVLAALQQRLTTPERLWTQLADTGPVPRIGTMRESVRDAEGGIDSLPERHFATLLRDYGLPEPTRQARTRGTSGTYYLDADFEPWRVAVEVDGAHHRDVGQSDADLRRQNELVIAGRTVLRFSSFQVRHEPGHVARCVRRALLAAGWPG